MVIFMMGVGVGVLIGLVSMFSRFSNSLLVIDEDRGCDSFELFWYSVLVFSIDFYDSMYRFLICLIGVLFGMLIVLLIVLERNG